jgi:hypothetical protein
MEPEGSLQCSQDPPPHKFTLSSDRWFQSSQLNAPAALPPGKEPLVPIG